MLRVACIDGTANSFPSMHGMWLSGGKALSCFKSPNFMPADHHATGLPEQVLYVWRPCKKVVDCVSKHQRDIQVFCSGHPSLAELEPVEAPEISLEADILAGGILKQADDDPRTLTSSSSLSCHQISLKAPFQGPSESHHSLHALEFQAVNADFDDSLRDTMKASSKEAKGADFPVLMGDAHVYEESEVFQKGIRLMEVHGNAGAPVDVQHFRLSQGYTHHACDKRIDLGAHVSSYNQSGRGVSASGAVQIPGSMHVRLSSLPSQDGDSDSVELSNAEDASKLSVADVNVEESTSTSTSSCNIAILRLPAYRTPTQLRQARSDNVVYLESLGVDCSRVFASEPKVSRCSVKQIRAIVSALEYYGLKWTDTGRLFNLCPRLLLLKPEMDLEAVTSFLFNEAGISPEDFRRTVRRCPRLLTADVKTQLRPILSFLRSLGYAKLGQTITNNPGLLSFDIKKRLIPRLRLLESWGLTYREAAGVAARFPAIFNYSATDNLQLKYDYLVQEMGGSKDDILEFPQYFGYSLDWRIRPRHQCLVRLNVCVSIEAMLVLSEEEFSARCSTVVVEHKYNGGSLYKSIKRKIRECKVKAANTMDSESAEVHVLVSALSA